MSAKLESIRDGVEEAGFVLWAFRGHITSLAGVATMFYVSPVAGVATLLIVLGIWSAISQAVSNC